MLSLFGLDAASWLVVWGRGVETSPMRDGEPGASEAISILSGEPFAVSRREIHHYGWPGLVALGAHVVVIIGALVGFARLPQPPDSSELVVPTTLVFRIEAGPGGGGGGGGEESPTPASVLKIEGDDVAAQAMDPAPKEPLVFEPEVAVPPEPESELEVAGSQVDAPFVPAAPDSVRQKGVLEEGVPGPDSAGAGTGGGAGTGSGTGRGPGSGPGVGEGEGGGFGGGAHRLGSGVEPPSVIRSVDPDYTEDALRRKIQGNVILEVVILRDGRVGQVRVVKSLDAGLDRNAIAAVQQWRFRPGRLQGQPVAVIAGVVVEFRLY